MAYLYRCRGRSLCRPFVSLASPARGKPVAAILLPCVLLACACTANRSPSRLDPAGPMPPSTPLPFKLVACAGPLAERYEKAWANLTSHTDDRYSLASFVASASGQPGALWWDWPGDQCGRWYSVLNATQGHDQPEPDRGRKAIADAILPRQTADGYFGPPGAINSDDARIPSGNGFALRGLMDAYTDTNDPRYLDAARKLARYFETLAPQWETRARGKLHEFYGHCLDGLVALYVQGGDRWALDLAERLAQHAGRTGHTHHSLSLCRGLIDLARVTGKPEYLAKVEDYLAWCREQQTVTGGLPEAMPASEQDEGCGLADWIVANLMMFAATGQDRYLDDAEHTLVNHFAMNQFATGGFGHRSFSQEIVGGKKWQGWDGQFGSENPGCCSLWGAWALGQARTYLATECDGAVLVNLYTPATLTMPGRNMQLHIAGDFPNPARAKITVRCSRPTSCALALRVPRWAQRMSVKCGGAAAQTAHPGRRILLRRTWGTSTDIDIEFVSGLRAVPWPTRKPQGVAIFQGPLCLGLCSNANDVNLPWTLLVDAADQPLPDALGQPQVVDPAGNTTAKLEPVSASWTRPDVKDPARYRILFQTKRAE